MLFMVIFHLLFLLRKEFAIRQYAVFKTKSMNIFLTLENYVTVKPGDPAMGKWRGVGGRGEEGELKRRVAILTRLRAAGGTKGPFSCRWRKSPRRPVTQVVPRGSQGTECPGKNGLRATFPRVQCGSAGYWYYLLFCLSHLFLQYFVE